MWRADESTAVWPLGWCWLASISRIRPRTSARILAEICDGSAFAIGADSPPTPGGPVTRQSGNLAGHRNPQPLRQPVQRILVSVTGSGLVADEGCCWEHVIGPRGPPSGSCIVAVSTRFRLDVPVGSCGQPPEFWLLFAGGRI